MNNSVKIALGASLLLGFAAAGYWLGTHASTGAKPATGTSTTERTVLYYRNPMGLPDTSPVPKKDAMGMDYVPVYQGDERRGSEAVIDIGIDKVQKLGVKSEAARLRELDRTLRATGRIEIDERRIHTIAPRFEGWVEQLYVNTTGQTVSKGQPLFDVYSPELVSAQREHELAVQGLAALKNADDDARQGMQQLVDASAQRLKNWNMTDTPAGNGAAHPRVTFRAPVSGTVLEKKAVQGMRFMPGEVLYQIVDLSSVWVIAEVSEQDIGLVQPGDRAQVTVDAYPECTFDGRVVFIYPTLSGATRTVQVRMEIANPKGQLKPSMFAMTQIAVGKRRSVMTVPISAVIDSGTRQVVLVRLEEGRFEPRQVTLGSRSDDFVEVLGGVAEGEQVVTSANFLIDSESNLKAALGGLDSHAAQATTPAMAQKPAPVTAQGNSAHNSEAKTKKPGSVGHQALGILVSINDDGSVSITHEPIASLGWPGMTMDFMMANAALLSGIEPGRRIAFEIVERKPGEWVITKLNAAPQESGHAEHDH